MTSDLIGKIHCCDCLDLMSKMEDKSVDLTVTSPPYDNLRDYHGYSFDFENIAKELYRITKDGGVVVWIVGDSTVNGSETLTTSKQKIYFREQCGFNIHDTMIYEKAGISYPDDDRYYSGFEYMFVLSIGSPKHFFPIKDRKNYTAGSTVHGTERKKNGEIRQHKSCEGNIIGDVGIRMNIWRYSIGGGNISSDRDVHKHPAAFPQKLAQDHIHSWSNEDCLIYDPFMGSGTTAIAAERLGRRWIGSEISPEYVKLANKRIENERAQYKIEFEKVV